MAELSVERVSFEAALAALLDLYGIEGGTGGNGEILPARLGLINATKVKLDEMIPEGEGVVYDLEDTPNVSDPYDLLINYILPEAGKRVLMNCPKNYLDVTVSDITTGIPDSTDNKIGYIPLPANFLRFIRLKMRDWQRPVINIVEDESQEYFMQFNAHVRGGVAKPKAIFNHKYILNTLGGLVTVTLNSGGTGYTPGTVTLTLVQDGAASGTVTATANNSGIITSINTIATAGTNYFVADNVTTTAGAGSGCKVNITEIVEAYTMKRVIEYFSILYSHAIDYLFYIQETEPENIQTNLHDALTWMAAGMVLQIIEKPDLARLAFEQEQACYNKLNNGD